MSMREDCCHYESRTYDDGEAARFCTKDLAPEAPWRCPDPCAGYEHIVMIAGDFEAGTLGSTPMVEDEPEVPVADLVDVLADAEAIVSSAAPDIVAELDRSQRKRTSWWRRRRSGGDDDFRLSSR
jgi:hypothetical protein